MSEAEVAAAFASFGQMFLSGLQAAFAVVSAYLVAVYFFLCRAPFMMRFTAFLFFSATLLTLALFMIGAARFGDGIYFAMQELKPKSALGRTVIELLNHQYAYALLWISFAVGLATYVTLAYLTFFYRWPAVRASHD